MVRSGLVSTVKLKVKPAGVSAGNTLLFLVCVGRFLGFWERSSQAGSAYTQKNDD